MKVRGASYLVFLLILGVVILRGIFMYDSHRKIIPMSNKLNDEKVRILTMYDDIESWKIPAVVPLNDEQRSYVSDVVTAMIRVMEQSSSLEAEESKILGVGKFRWPKNPEDPIKTMKSFHGENFRMKGMSASFQRERENAPWGKAGLTVHPRNFPAGVYLMNLPHSIFEDFKLQHVTQERREGERIKDPLVFYLAHKKIENFSLRIEARADVVKIDERFPTSFHAIVMLRGSQ